MKLVARGVSRETCTRVTTLSYPKLRMRNAKPLMELAIEAPGISPKDVPIRHLVELLEAASAALYAVARESGVEPPVMRLVNNVCFALTPRFGMDRELHRIDRRMVRRRFSLGDAIDSERPE